MSEEEKAGQEPCPDHAHQLGVRGKQCRETWEGSDGKRKRCGKGYGGVRY